MLMLCYRCCTISIVALFALGSALANERVARQTAPAPHPPAQTAPPQEKPAAKEYVLPTERCGGYFLAPTMINGKGPFMMLFDTGASITVLTPAAARAAGVSNRIRKIDIGPLHVSGRIRCSIKPLKHLARALGRDYDGILGHQVFAKVLLTYDYPAGEIRFRLGALTDDLPGIAPMSTSKRPFIGALVGDKKINVLLDTGSAYGLSLKNFNHYTFQQPPTPISTRMRIDGLSVLHAGRLANDVRFGSFTLAKPIVSSASGDSLLGIAILKDFVLTIDQQRGRIQIVKPDGSAIAFPVATPACTGLGLALKPLEEALLVRRVFPDTPADEAGLRRDDRIIASNGEPIMERGCADFPPDASKTDPVCLTIERGGETFDVELTPGVLVQ